MIENTRTNISETEDAGLLQMATVDTTIAMPQTLIDPKYPVLASD